MPMLSIQSSTRPPASSASPSSCFRRATWEANAAFLRCYRREACDATNDIEQTDTQTWRDAWALHGSVRTLTVEQPAAGLLHSSTVDITTLEIARIQIGGTVALDYEGATLLHIDENRYRARLTDDIAHHRAEGGTAPTCPERCLWCDKVLGPGRRRGSAKRFCCAGHRNAFWTAARRWVM